MPQDDELSKIFPRWYRSEEFARRKGEPMSRWRGDKRENKRRLSQDEIAADAYLIAQWECDRTVIAELPGGGRDLPLPRLTGYVGEETVVALVPGRFVSRLLQKKRGFSETEAYFNTQRKLFQGEGAKVVQVIWDPGNDVPADRMEPLISRADGELCPIREADMPRIAALFQKFSAGEQPCLDNWLLESLRWATRYRG